MDIARLTAENHLKYFALSLEDCDDLLATDTSITSTVVFDLYKTVKSMSKRYSKSVPGFILQLTID